MADLQPDAAGQVRERRRTRRASTRSAPARSRVRNPVALAQPDQRPSLPRIACSATSPPSYSLFSEPHGADHARRGLHGRACARRTSRSPAPSAPRSNGLRAPGGARPAEPELPAAPDLRADARRASSEFDIARRLRVQHVHNQGFEAESRRASSPTRSARQPRRRHPGAARRPPVSYRAGEPARLVLLARQLRLRATSTSSPACSATTARRASRRATSGRSSRPSRRRGASARRLHARTAPFSNLSAARRLGTAGQPGGAARTPRSSCSAPTAARATRSAARSSTGLVADAGRQPEPQVGDDGADQRRPRLRRSRTTASPARRRLPEEHEGPAARACRCRSRPSCRTRLENIGTVRNRGVEALARRATSSSARHSQRLGSGLVADGRAQRGA